MKCGLLGRTLGYSYSPKIHGYLGNYSYELFEKEPEELESFLKNGDFNGINVTIPYKKDVIPYLDELSPTARKMGAVNTIVRRSDGTLLGHNTDYFGFQSMIIHAGIPVEGKKALVLGSGGASNTVRNVLLEMGANVIVISRSGENNYNNLHLHKDAALIVNTTPVGVYPKTGISPVDLKQFPSLQGVLDVVYNPAKTQLLLDADAMGLPHENGLWMLVAQAKESSEWFTGNAIDDSVIAKIHQKLSSQMKNIILIGMPGCGKSTIGAMLAKVTGRLFMDADETIVSMAKKSIPDIFSQDGEDVFRQWETTTLAELGKQSGRIIATGGGCVTKERNYNLLHQNGNIFWLQRDIEKLPTNGRPLSQQNSLASMYQTREPMYRQFSDYTVDNNGGVELTVQQILSYLEGKT